MIENIYEKIVERFEEGRPCVLATIIRQSGSSPRGVGTKFMIVEDGSYVGTIGGGQLEAKVLEGAKEVFTVRSPRRLFFRLMGTDVAETDMLCGGDVEVFLEPLLPENINDLHIFRKAVETHRRGGTGIMATLLNEEGRQGGRTVKMFFEADGQVTGALPGTEYIEEMLKQGLNSILDENRPGIILCKDRAGRDLELFVEPMSSDPVVYIFGGGHISTQIAPLAALVGFKVVVIDDRSEFADPRKFPDAVSVCQYPFEGVLDRITVDLLSYLVIVTRGHMHDRTVLEQALRTEAKYIGMIGSRRKRGIVYKKLLEEGFTQDDLDRVHSPIGLEIGGETPEEIAVSIVAELIQVRAGHKKD